MSLIIEPTAISAFYTLVKDGERKSGIALEDDLQAFVVYALLRNIDNNTLKEFTFAEAFLEAFHKDDIARLEKVVDHSLIYAGLYPKRAEKMGLSRSYYLDIGVMASEQLSSYYAKIKSSYYEVYYKIACQFHSLVEVLKAFVGVKK